MQIITNDVSGSPDQLLSPREELNYCFVSSGLAGSGTSLAPFCSSTVEPFVMLSVTTLVNWILPQVFSYCAIFIRPLVMLLSNKPHKTIDNN